MQLNLVNSSFKLSSFAVLFIHIYVNSCHLFIVFLILKNWETDLQKSIDFLLNHFFEMICMRTYCIKCTKMK